MFLSVLARVPYILLVVFISSAICYADNEFDLRKVKWGMSKDEVKKQEEGNPVYEGQNPELSREEIVGFKESLSGKSVRLIYGFFDDRLYRAMYSLDEKYSENTKYLEDYFEIKEMLVSKYGKPKKDETVWRNNLFKGKTQYYGNAIASGHLIMFSSWDSKDAEITCGIDGDNFKTHVSVVYKSKKIAPLVDAAKKEKEKNKL